MSGERVSLREFARRKNWNPGYAHKLKTNGRLVMVGDKVDVEASEQLLAESADPARAHLARQQQQAARSPVDDDTASPADHHQPQNQGSGGLSNNATFNKAKTASQVYDAKLRELEYQQKVGKLIDVADARRLAFTAFRALRDAVLNVPARVQDQCAAEADAFVIGQLLEDALNAALGAFSVEHAVRDTPDEDEFD